MNTITENAPEGEAHGGYAAYHVPTWTEKLRRALGFRYHLGEEPEGYEELPGWMATDIRMSFSFMDRLRLLLTGRLFIQAVQHTNVEVDHCKSRISWQIKAPGER